LRRRFDLVQVVHLLAFSCVALAMTGCLALVGNEPAVPPSVGVYPVGVTTIEVNDPGRDRWLTTEVWYPAATPSRAEPVVYDVQALDMTVARLRSAARAHRDVEPWRDGGARPVVLVSHGRGSTRFGNVSLAEVLASHGYIVAAPDHTGHTIDDQLNGIGDEERAKSAMDRPLDLSGLLDDLVARSSRPTSMFRGLIDVDRIGIAGHSFGGLAALGISGARFDAARQRKDCTNGDDDWRCSAADVFGANAYRYRDSRIKAALLITPAGYDLYRKDGVAEVDVPMLVVGARRDQNTRFDAFSKPTYEALTGPRYFLDLKEAGHLTATDLCEMIDSIGFLAKTFGGKDAQDGCGFDDYTSRDALQSVASASLPFFDLYLNGDGAAEERLQLALAPTLPQKFSCAIRTAASCGVVPSSSARRSTASTRTASLWVSRNATASS
jgi:predicted dienelactone hydrolase